TPNILFERLRPAPLQQRVEERHLEVAEDPHCPSIDSYDELFHDRVGFKCPVIEAIYGNLPEGRIFNKRIWPTKAGLPTHPVKAGREAHTPSSPCLPNGRSADLHQQEWR